jgi:hypothetical protein
MNTLSPEEARQALAEIDSISHQTRLALQSRLVSSILMMWGVLWAVIFSSGYLAPAHSGRIAWVLNTFGFLCTAFLVARRNRQLRQDTGRKHMLLIATLWAALLVYAILLPMLLVHSRTARLTLMLCTVMLGYVLQGIWMRDRIFVFIGLFITSVALACHAWLSPPHFLLGLGLLGGGALFAGGLVIRLRWK